jgi:hypothetical protein
MGRRNAASVHVPTMATGGFSGTHAVSGDNDMIAPITISTTKAVARESATPTGARLQGSGPSGKGAVRDRNELASEERSATRCQSARRREAFMFEKVQV